jgi:hypothetical protein
MKFRLAALPQSWKLVSAVGTENLPSKIQILKKNQNQNMASLPIVFVAEIAELFQQNKARNVYFRSSEFLIKRGIKFAKKHSSPELINSILLHKILYNLV